MTQLSIVTTLYKSEKYILPFYKRCLKVLEKLGIQDFEFVFTNDCSPDASLSTALELQKYTKHVKVVDLARNAGHHKAMMTGLEHADGEYIFLIDVDLEEEPENLAFFWEAIYKNNPEKCDMVYGIQEARRGNYIEKITGSIFYSIFNFLADEIKLKKNLLTIRIMTKRFVEKLMMFKDRDFYFAPICSLVGFNQKFIHVKKNSTSPTSYSFRKKISLFINSIFSYSRKPLFAIFYLGLIITITSFFTTLLLIIKKLSTGVGLDGWTSIMTSIWFFGGIITLFLGVLGIYLSQTLAESKHRPFVVIKEIYEKRESLEKTRPSILR